MSDPFGRRRHDYGNWANSIWIDDDQIFNAYLQHIIYINVLFIKKLFLHS